MMELTIDPTHLGWDKPPLKCHPEALEAMATSPYNYPDTRWAAYQNRALDSAGCGDLRYMAVGPSNTVKDPPKRYPDSHLGCGWAYCRVGWVDFETGNVEMHPEQVALRAEDPAQGVRDALPRAWNRCNL